MTRGICLTLLLFSCLGCGYTSQLRVPDGIETISVSVFDNRTKYREVEFDFTRALRLEVSAKTPLSIADADEADAIMSGEILRYRRRLLRETRHDRPTEYAISITVSYQLVNQRTGVVLASNDGLKRSADYQLQQGQTEQQARQEVVRELARELVQHAFLRWE